MNYLNEEDMNQKVDLKVWNRLFKYAMRHKGLVIGIVVCLFLVSFILYRFPLLF